MTDRPILYSGPMVVAQLEGRKGQTRRILKPQVPEGREVYFEGREWFSCNAFAEWLLEGVRFAKGDRLWVRETWRTAPEFDHLKPADIPKGAPILHMAGTGVKFPSSLWGKVRVAIHMPRWASRLTNIVTDVRVQRLQEISEEDAIAEGVVRYEPTDDDPAEFAPFDGADIYNNAVSAYRQLWGDINGDGSWDANPWVTATTFTVDPRNIDQAAA